MMCRSTALLLALTCAASPAARPQEAPKRIALYHPFDEGAGIVTRDQSGGRRHAVLHGDVRWVQGRYGQAVQFPGDLTSFLKLSLPAKWYLAHQEAMTVLMCVKASGKPGQIIFGAHYPSEGRLYLAIAQAGHWALGLGERNWGRDERGRPRPADSEWHALAMTLNCGTAMLYVDGEQYLVKPYGPLGIGMAPQVGSIAGAASADFAFKGIVDELAVFEGVLSLDEIRAAMKGIGPSGLLAAYGSAQAEDQADRGGLVAEWRFDDGPGARVADSSGNGLHGRATACEPAEGLEGLGLRLPARGQSCWVEVPHRDQLDKLQALTVEAWLYWDPRSANFAALVDSGYLRQMAIYFHRYAQRVYVCLVTNKSHINAATPVRVPVYQWTHLALTWSADTSRAILYVNGQQVWSHKLEGERLAKCSVPLWIGRGRGAEGRTIGCLAGVVDEIRMYSRALSADAVAKRYQALAGFAADRSVAKWVPTSPSRVQRLDDTCLDAQTGALTYPAFPLVPAKGKHSAVSAADFPSIQAAVDSLPQSGGMVSVPSGKWEITEPIVLRGNVSLVGLGASSVIVNKNLEGANAIECRETTQYRPKHLHPPGAAGHHGVLIANLQVRGNPKSGNGIGLYQSDHFTIENCMTSFNGKSGIYLSYGEENDIVRGVISKWNGEHGLYIEGCHDTLISASHFEENRLDGVHVQKDNIQAGIVGCNAEDNGRFGIYNKGRWTQVIGCESDTNEGGAFVFIGPESEYSTVVTGSIGTIRAVGAHHVAITGNNSSVLLSDCHDCTVVGNTGAVIHLEDACCNNAVNANTVANIIVGAWCHHNAITGNICRGQFVDRGRDNAVTGNVATKKP